MSCSRWAFWAGLVVFGLGTAASLAGARATPLLSADDARLARGGTSSGNCFVKDSVSCSLTQSCRNASTNIEILCTNGDCLGSCNGANNEDVLLTPTFSGFLFTGSQNETGCGSFVDGSTCVRVSGKCVCTDAPPSSGPCFQQIYTQGASCS